MRRMSQPEEKWTTGAVVAVTALFAIPVVIAGGIALSRVQDQRVKDVLTGALALVAAVAVLVWAVSAGVRTGLAKRERDVRAAGSRADNASRAGGFPVQPAAPAVCYIVTGVSKETAADVTIQVEAASAANARVKAELQGVVVTEVREITA